MINNCDKQDKQNKTKQNKTKITSMTENNLPPKSFMLYPYQNARAIHEIVEYVTTTKFEDVAEAYVASVYGEITYGCKKFIRDCGNGDCVCGLVLEERMNRLYAYLRRVPTMRETLSSFEYPTIVQWANKWVFENVFEAQMDYGTKEFQDLHGQNKKKFKKPRSRKTDLLYPFGCAEKRIKKTVEKTKIKFEAQMFDLALPLKMNEDQFSTLSDLATRVVDGLDKLNSSVADPEILQGIGKRVAAGAIGGVTGMCIETIAGILTKVREKLGRGGIIMLSATVLGVLYMRCESTLVFRMSVLAFLALCGKMFEEGLVAIFMQVLDTFASEEAEAQSLDLGSMTDLLVAFLGAGLVPGMMNKKKNFIETLGDVGKNIRGVENVVELVVRLTQRLLDYASQTFGYESYTLMSTFIPKVDQWVSETRAMINELTSGKLHHDLATFEKVSNLEDRAYELLSLYASKSSSSNVGAIIRPLSNELSKMRTMLQTEGIGMDKLRQAALMVFFFR